MALPKLFQRIFFHNNTTPSINEDSFNAVSKGLSDVDDRVISLAGTIMEDVPQIQEDMEELEADMALIDTKIASATAEANRATTAANNAAASVISAGNKALVSEGWAKGTQNGTAVGSSSPYYHNNAEYFKNQARSFTPQGYQDLVDDVDSLKETLTNFEESITGEVVDSEPYVLRQGLGNLADMSLVGGSVAWNQLIDWRGHATATYDGITYTNNSDGSYTVNGTATGTSTFYTGIMTLIANHKYYFCGTPLTGSDNTYRQDIRIVSSGSPIASSLDYGTGKIIAPSSYEAVQVRTTIRVNNGAVINNKKFYPQLFDLTQLFGSTIADYIYSLEQATAGAGVAWFRKYFPNLYYGYQSGKIESVNVASRKVVGKNLLPFIINTQTYKGITCINNEDGTYTLNGTSTGNVDFVIAGTNFGSEQVVFPKGAYIMTNDNSNSNIELHIGYGSATYISGQTLLPVNATNGIAWIIMRVKNGATVNNITVKPMLRFSTVEDDTFEPYQSSTYAFDSSKQLRGIPKLVDNKLSYDGDIYTADGTVTRKYGIVDLGTLDWSTSSQDRFYSSGIKSVVKKPTTTSIKFNGLCTKYLTASNDDVYYHNVLNSVAINNTGDIQIYDVNYASYADTAAFKAAMSGVYLVYELATPTTESANAYQNPQRAFSDGTEEFVDYGVQSATRDVSIPVGNNTTYQLNETLPPTEDYVDGALKFKADISALGTDESGRTTASRAYTAGEFFYKDGKMYKVLTSIAQGATFTINTNCQQTTLFAELKALAQ